MKRAVTHFCYHHRRVVIAFYALIILAGTLICCPFNLLIPDAHWFGSPRFTENLFCEGKGTRQFFGRLESHGQDLFKPFEGIATHPKAIADKLNELITGPNLFPLAKDFWERLLKKSVHKAGYDSHVRVAERLISKGGTDESGRQRLNRYLIDLAFPGILKPASYWPASQKGLEVNSAMARIFLDDDPERDTYELYKKRFGDDEICVVAIQSDQTFTPEFIRKIKELTELIQEIPGVEEIISYTNVENITGSEGGFAVKPLMAAIPTTPEEMQKFKTDLYANEIFGGTLISKDGRTTAINVFFELRPNADWKFKQDVVKAIQKLLREHFDKGQVVESHVGGLAPFTADLHVFMLEDILIFFTMAFVLIIAVLWVSFKSLLGLLPVGMISIALTICGAAIVLMGKNISLVTTIAPSLLIADGTSYGIHLMANYYQSITSEMTDDKDRERVILGLANYFRPVFIAAATTFVGFSSLATNEVNTIREFGIIASVGVVICYLVTVTFIPAALAFFPLPDAGHQTEVNLIPFISRDHISTFVNWVCTRPKKIAIIFVFIYIGCFIGAYNLEIMTDYPSFFHYNDPVPTTARFIRKNLSGERPVIVMLDTQRDNGAKDPELLAIIEEVQKFAEAYDKSNDPKRDPAVRMVSQSITFGDYLKNMNKAMHGDNKEWEKLPDSADLVSQYMLLYGNKQEIKRYVTDDFRYVSLLVRSGFSRSDDVLNFCRELKSRAAELLGPYNKKNNSTIGLEVTGSMYLLQKSAEAISWGQAISLFTASIGVFLIIFFFFWDWRMALITVPANLFPIFFNFAFMAAIGIPINTGTSIVSSIALGVAVDDTIHLCDQFRVELARSPTVEVAIINAVEHVLSGVVFTTIALFLGFLVLCLSHFSPIQAIGYLTANTMFVAVFGDMFLTLALFKLCYRDPQAPEAI